MKKLHSGLLSLIAFIVIALLAYGAITMKDDRNAAEKIGDAIHELPQGVDKAARQLEDRTTADKLKDAVDDTADKIKGDTSP